MSWLAHMVGGPLDGVMESEDGHWPFVAKQHQKDFVGYHLVYGVVSHNRIVPYTPLIYLWDGVKGTQAQHLVEAYIALHSEGGGLLAEYELTRVRPDLFIPPKV